MSVASVLSDVVILPEAVLVSESVIVPELEVVLEVTVGSVPQVCDDGDSVGANRIIAESSVATVPEVEKE